MKQATAIPFAFIATIALVAAFAIAMLYVTELGEVEMQTRGLVFAYAAACMGMLVFAYVRLLDSRVGLFMMLFTHVVWFAWPAVKILLDPMRHFGDSAKYRLGPEVVAKTALLMLLFLGLNLAAYYVTTWRSRAPQPFPLGRDPRPLVPHPHYTLAALFIFGLLPFVIYGGSLTAVLKGILASRTEGKAWSHGAHVVSSKGPVVVIARSAAVTFAGLGLWWYAYRKQFAVTRSQSLTVLGLALFLLMITYFDSGTRTWTLLIVAPVFLGMLMARLSRRRFIRGTIVGLFTALVAISLAQLQRAYRFAADIDQVQTEQVLQLDDNDFFTETAIAVDLVPRIGYVEQFEPILYVTNPIPRFLWEDKPIPLTLRVFSSGRSGFDEYMKTGVSRMPSVVGQYYLSWGLWGVIGMGLFWGWMMGAFENLYRRSGPHTLGAFVGLLGLVFLFGSGRGLYPGFHYPVLIAGLLLMWQRRSHDDSPTPTATIQREETQTWDARRSA